MCGSNYQQYRLLEKRWRAAGIAGPCLAFPEADLSPKEEERGEDGHRERRGLPIKSRLVVSAAVQ